MACFRPILFLLAAVFCAIGGLAAETAAWPSYRHGGPLNGQVATLPTAYKLKWSQKPGGGIEASPVVLGHLVVVADGDGRISALDRHTGKSLWTATEKGGVEATPLLVDSLVIVATLAGDVVAYQQADGTEIWRLKTGEAIHGGPNLATVAGKRLLLVGGYDFQLRAIEAGTGKPVWSLKSENFINGTPAIDEQNALALFGGCDGWLRAIDLATGQEKFKAQADSYLPSSPSIGQGVVYAGSHGGILHAVSLADGKTAWTFQASKENPLLAPPAITGRQIFLISGRQRFVLEAKTGKKQLEFTGRGEATAAPVSDGDKALVADAAGWLTISRLADGQTLWEYELGPKIVASPAVAGGELFVADTQGNVYGFEAETRP